MTTLFQALYTYTYENRMQYTREDKLQYSQSSRIAERMEKEPREMLSEEGLQRLDEYLEEEGAIQSLELKTMFRAGLSIALELSRIQ